MIKFDKKIDGKCWDEYKLFIGKQDSVWGFEIPKEKKYNKEEIDEVLRKFNLDFSEQVLRIFLKSLEKVFDHKIPTERIKIFLTTMPFSTYSEKEGWIAVSIRTNVPLKTIAHELNHKFFYEKTKGVLSFEEYNIIKEYLTVINNSLFKENLKIFDSGYPEHQEIRKKIYELWLKNKNINDCVYMGKEYYREQGKN